MKFVFGLILTLSTTAAYADSVTLTAYTNDNNYATSAYSFRQLTQDPDKSGNKWELLYNPNNQFTTELTVSDVGSIVDLGSMSCADVKNPYEQTGEYPGVGHGGYPYKEDRLQDPMFWMVYSSAWEKLSGGRVSFTDAIVGHCYLIHQASYNGITIALFHVKSLDEGTNVEIDEVEVFQAAELK